MIAGWKRPPEWLEERIEEELRRGIVLAREEADLEGFVLHGIRFRMYLGGEWHVTSFDSEGRRIASGAEV